MFKKQLNQNSPLLETILSNIKPNPSISNITNITDLVLNTNHPLQSCRIQYESCSKHEQKKGDYFEHNYPWVKYCQNCALNLALCGKKIQKTLSSQQMVNKIKLCDTLYEISQSIKSSQSAYEQYSFLSQQLQQSRQWFVSILTQVDTMISQLTQMRNFLQEKVQQKVNKQIKQIFDRQSLLVSKKIQLINEKSMIECGFVELIGKQNQQDTLVVINQAKQLILETDSLMANQQYRVKLSENVKIVESIFQEKLFQINQIKICSTVNQFKTPQNSIRMSVAFGQKIRNYRGSKTQQAINDDLSFSEGKRLLSQSSTVQHSGLVTPCQMAGNIQLNPLGEISQNRRTNRTALQLKARCRSKSSQKKVQVNVRENIQNVLKKKLV